MCIPETRRADYATYAATNSAADATWKNFVMENIPVGAGDEEPAVNVSWENAKAFYEWLNKRERRTYPRSDHGRRSHTGPPATVQPRPEPD